ncbi:T9SS type A sorting domain-containing protein [Balneolales bacterium ANBcel1]|nr:T9SS type A sorting domain-containing protein [Balneolales bacterium ANBcel1]
MRSAPLLVSFALSATLFMMLPPEPVKGYEAAAIPASERTFDTKGKESDRPAHAAQKGPGHDDPVKCFTPHVIRHQADPASTDPEVLAKMQEVQNLLIPGEQEFLSESGRFRLLYVTEGTHAVPTEGSNGSGVPDYVEWAAEYADYAFRKQVEELGFVDPSVHQGVECGSRIGEWQDTTLSIRFRSFGFYGLFFPSSPFEIQVHNNFRGFPPNTDPDGHVHGALRATIAHELKHVIQYATNCFQGDAGNQSWLEMDATMMENIVFPQVNDYYNYITSNSSVFRAPHHGIPSESVADSYGHVTWSLFYAEYLTMDYWAGTWDAIADDHFIPMADAMKKTLRKPSDAASDRAFSSKLARNHLWHATAGSRQIPGYGFSEADAYPDAYMAEQVYPIPERYNDWLELPPLSGTYRMLRPGPGQIGEIDLHFTHNHHQAAVGIVGYQRDGGAMEWIVPAAEGNETQSVSPFTTADLDSFIVVIVNADRSEPLDYSIELSVRSVPEIATLEHNYPNPFSTSRGAPHTRIVFSVPEDSRVSITMYDVLGRRVRVILDEEMKAGRHEVPVDAGGLPSGVYLYRFRTEDVQQTGKMTLIR